uniref:Uncharacterized protein n=1 Tax=Knipowitschia caucasica TaxID=637954 RepID=A0AAV2JIB3_KNICA
MIKCSRMDTCQIVCIRVPRSQELLQKEVSLLLRMKDKGAEQRNIVEYLMTAEYGFDRALVFENLDLSLTSFFNLQYQDRCGGGRSQQRGVVEGFLTAAPETAVLFQNPSNLVLDFWEGYKAGNGSQVEEPEGRKPGLSKERETEGGVAKE